MILLGHLFFDREGRLEHQITKVSPLGKRVQWSTVPLTQNNSAQGAKRKPTQVKNQAE